MTKSNEILIGVYRFILILWWNK